MLSQTGASVYEVQKLLRHKQLSTTLHYVQTDEKSLAEASERLYRLAHKPKVPPASDQSVLVEPQDMAVTSKVAPYPSPSAQIVNFVPIGGFFHPAQMVQGMARVSQAEHKVSMPVA